ncbi:MAG: PIN domain-containing protein [Myxococcales bacterium]
MIGCLLDSSFVIDLLNEVADGAAGPAIQWLRRNPRAELWISPVTYAEVLEGAVSPVAVRARLMRFRWQTLAHAQAEKVALRQRRARRRLGENDAWQVAIAECMDGIIVGHDEKAFGHLGDRYQDHRRTIATTT